MRLARYPNHRVGAHQSRGWLNNSAEESSIRIAAAYHLPVRARLFTSGNQHWKWPRQAWQWDGYRNGPKSNSCHLDASERRAVASMCRSRRDSGDIHLARGKTLRCLRHSSIWRSRDAPAHQVDREDIHFRERTICRPPASRRRSQWQRQRTSPVCHAHRVCRQIPGAGLGFGKFDEQRVVLRSARSASAPWRPLGENPAY